MILLFHLLFLICTNSNFDLFIDNFPDKKPIINPTINDIAHKMYNIYLSYKKIILLIETAAMMLTMSAINPAQSACLNLLMPTEPKYTVST